jgi:hypothetical protein
MHPPQGAEDIMLPPELLQRILQFVPQRQRLTKLAIVCKAWAAAAVAATTTISITERWLHPSLEVWLQKHGTGVGQLDICLAEQDGYADIPYWQLSASKELVLPRAQTAAADELVSEGRGPSAQS